MELLMIFLILMWVGGVFVGVMIGPFAKKAARIARAGMPKKIVTPRNAAAARGEIYAIVNPGERVAMRVLLYEATRDPHDLETGVCEARELLADANISADFELVRKTPARVTHIRVVK